VDVPPGITVAKERSEKDGELRGDLAQIRRADQLLEIRAALRRLTELLRAESGTSAVEPSFERRDGIQRRHDGNHIDAIWQLNERLERTPQRANKEVQGFAGPPCESAIRPSSDTR
jgi:hypothetical protein